jgi:hypothetical protein
MPYTPTCDCQTGVEAISDPSQIPVMPCIVPSELDIEACDAFSTINPEEEPKS